MAELILKVKRDLIPDPAYQDGDIICAMNDRRIKDIHAQHACSKRNLGFNVSGLRPDNSLTEDYLSRVMEYKFVRVSRKEVKRINLRTLAEDIISGTPNASGEYMDVPLFLARRILHEGHLIFGSTGSERWYGGNCRAPHNVLDDVWAVIEAKTPLRKINFTKWPFTDLELKQNLAISVDDFTDDERDNLTSQVIDAEGATIKKRKRRANWRSLSNLGVSEASIEDRATRVDVRGIIFSRQTIVEVKP